MTTISKLKIGEWVVSHSAAETQGLGLRVGKRLKSGTVLMLEGDIGAGKTTFTKGLAEGLGLKVDVSEVVSPTFVLIHEYPCRIPLYHIDLYRLDTVGLEEAALIEEYIGKKGVTAIEWAERASGLALRDYVRVELRHEAPTRRLVRIQIHGKIKWP